MEMVGSCHICGRQATSTCRMCGLVTCDKHLKNSVCTECRRGGRSENSEEEKRRLDEEDVYS